ncbi:MAG TPA: UbiX family flavin prenyltransferase [Thermoplasmata archaeon]|nr:UbiX family flavin prenyltransferase [Thermoplasmata archaeon]
MSGASGAPIAVRVLESLHAAGTEVALVVSAGGATVLKEEAGIEASSLERWATDVYRDDDLTAAVASGSRPTRGMAIVPCSTNTVARVALGLTDTLLTRAAHVHLKEHRRIVIVPRETPLSTILLRHLTSLSELGVVVLPPEPAYYLRPQRVEDVTDFVAGKVLDHLGVAHTLYRGWRAEGG